MSHGDLLSRFHRARLGVASVKRSHGATVKAALADRIEVHLDVAGLLEIKR